MEPNIQNDSLFNQRKQAYFDSQREREANRNRMNSKYNPIVQSDQFYVS